MTRTCTSSHTYDSGSTIQCQDRQHPEDFHHAHDSRLCIMWAVDDNRRWKTQQITDCPWPPAHEVARRADELGEKTKARRRPSAVTGPSTWVPPRIWDNTEGPCPIGGCGWDAEDTLDEHLYEHDYNELRPAVVRLALETDRLRAELAKSRRETLLAGAEIAESVGTESSAEAATRSTIIAKLRVEALANDECAKCGHRRGDHHYGGICKVRRSATTRCACRQYGFPTATPKED